MATQWLFNFVFSQITPHAVENLGWKTFVMFAVFNWALVVFVWFFVKETKGKSLEEMEERKSQLLTSRCANKIWLLTNSTSTSFRRQPPSRPRPRGAQDKFPTAGPRGCGSG